MRHAHYSGRAHHGADWGGTFRAALVVAALGLLGFWLMTGPAIDWLASLANWVFHL